MLSQAAGWLRGSSVGLAAQDCHAGSSGAFTGSVSAEMLQDAGCGHIIVGHSESEPCLVKRIRCEGQSTADRWVYAHHLHRRDGAAVPGWRYADRAGNPARRICARVRQHCLTDRRL